MYEIDLDKAKAQLNDLIQTALDGEEVLIMENGEPILKLVRVSSAESIFLHRVDETSAKPRRQSGSAKGLIFISDDFDEPLDDFGDYM
jgi:antitoxin (DNA-binding transcriptional repressor) of toxin-antitoxin stability system